MKTGLKPVLWSAAAFLLLIMIAVPVLNVPAFLLMMVPYVVLYATLPRGAFALHLIPVWAAATFIIGPSALLIGIFVLLPSIVMGHLYCKGAPASKVIRMVTLTLLAELMLELLMFEVILDYSLLDEIGDMIRTSINDVMNQGLLAEGWDPDYTEQLITMVIQMIPLTFIVLSFMMAVIAQYIARRALKGGELQIAAFPRAKDWRLPRVLVFYYLIAYMVKMFLSPTDESFIAVAVFNLVPLLSYVFAFQAIGFFFYIAHQRKWPRIVPILIAIPVLIFPPLSLIGVLDTVFPIRKPFTKP